MRIKKPGTEKSEELRYKRLRYEKKKKKKKKHQKKKKKKKKKKKSSTFPKIQQNFRSRKIKAGLPKPNSKCRIVNVAKPKLCNKTLHNKTLRNKVLHSTTLQIKASQIKASHD